jgi:hypothetical protein
MIDSSVALCSALASHRGPQLLISQDSSYLGGALLGRLLICHSCCRHQAAEPQWCHPALTRCVLLSLLSPHEPTCALQEAATGSMKTTPSSSALLLAVLAAACCCVQPGYAFWVDYSPAAVQTQLTNLANTPPVTNFLITPNVAATASGTIGNLGNSVTAAQRTAWKRIGGSLWHDDNRRVCCTHTFCLRFIPSGFGAHPVMSPCFLPDHACKRPSPTPSMHLTVHLNLRLNLHMPALPCHMCTLAHMPVGAKIWFFLSNYDVDFVNSLGQPTPPRLAASPVPAAGPSVVCGRNARQLVSAPPKQLVGPSASAAPSGLAHYRLSSPSAHRHQWPVASVLHILTPALSCLAGPPFCRFACPSMSELPCTVIAL